MGALLSAGSFKNRKQSNNGSVVKPWNGQSTNKKDGTKPQTQAKDGVIPQQCEIGSIRRFDPFSSKKSNSNEKINGYERRMHYLNG